MYGLSVLQRPLNGDCAKPYPCLQRPQEIQPFDTTFRNPVRNATTCNPAAQEQPLFVQTEQVAVDRTAVMEFMQLSTKRIWCQELRVFKKHFQHLTFSHGDMQVCNARFATHTSRVS